MKTSSDKNDSMEMNINEVFDQILLSEERIAEEGFKQGFDKGVSEGNLEAYHLGEWTSTLEMRDSNILSVFQVSIGELRSARNLDSTWPSSRTRRYRRPSTKRSRI